MFRYLLCTLKAASSIQCIESWASRVLVEWSLGCLGPLTLTHSAAKQIDYCHGILIRTLHGACLQTNVLPSIEYCSSIWDPHQQNVNAQVRDNTTLCDTFCFE